MFGARKARTGWWARRAAASEYVPFLYRKQYNKAALHSIDRCAPLDFPENFAFTIATPSKAVECAAKLCMAGVTVRNCYSLSLL